MSSKKPDHRWSLVYVGKLKEYQLTEAILIDGDWHTVANSTWETMESALNHIETSNSRRQKEAQA